MWFLAMVVTSRPSGKKHKDFETILETGSECSRTPPKYKMSFNQSIFLSPVTILTVQVTSLVGSLTGVFFKFGGFLNEFLIGIQLQSSARLIGVS